MSDNEEPTSEDDNIDDPSGSSNEGDQSGDDKVEESASRETEPTAEIVTTESLRAQAPRRSDADSDRDLSSSGTDTTKNDAAATHEGGAGADDTAAAQGTEVVASTPTEGLDASASDRSTRSTTRQLLKVGGVFMLLVAALFAYRGLNNNTSNGGDTTKETDGDELASGEGEAADFENREPANPGGGRQDAAGDGSSSNAIVIGVGDWAEAGFVGAIVSNILGEIGYQVQGPNAMGPDQAYNALAGGEIDIWTDGWMPAHEPYLAVEAGDGETVGDNVVTVGTTTPAGGVMGIFVTADWAEANNIETLEDVLAHPDAATLFDLTGDDIPDFYGCNPGWGCAETINEAIREHGWRISQYAGDYDASVQSALARADAGEPAMVFTWLPSTYGDALGIAESRFLLLGVADGDTGGEALATPCLADPCRPGFAVDDLVIVASTSFVEEHSDAAAVLEAIEVPQGDISAALAAVADGETLDAVAGAWIEANRDSIDNWIAESG